MQSVDAAFTAEEHDVTRRIAENFQASWHKQSTLGNRTFTIGVSTIGGNDIIGINPGAIGSPGNYKYFDETAYLTGLAWERGYNMPTGGLTKALAEAHFDNTSGRFTPRYMGGNSELSTSEYLRTPVLINAGFNLGSDVTIPQFAGLVTEQPELDVRDKTFSIKAADYIDFFQNKYLDQSVMSTGQRTDQVMVTLAQELGMSTAQYDFDTGINSIPFVLFEAGTKFSDAFHKLAEAENGHFYQDESGIFKFENRQHWSSSPYTSVQKIISTSQVIDAQAPNLDHLINVVEINSDYRVKQPNQTVFTLGTPVPIAANDDTEVFVTFDDPILQLDTPSGWIANTLDDGTGTNISSSVSLLTYDVFAQAAKLTFYNNSVNNGFLTSLTLTGRPAKIVSQLYTRLQDDSSVTAFQERVLTIDNPYIMNPTWANSYAQMILNDFAEIENLQRITIRAIPELQLGDLISWQGKYWRVYDIKTTLDPSVGFIQELLLLQRTITSYFQIGISTIGGSDRVAP